MLSTSALARHARTVPCNVSAAHKMAQRSACPQKPSCTARPDHTSCRFRTDSCIEAKKLLLRQVTDIELSWILMIVDVKDAVITHPVLGTLGGQRCEPTGPG